MYRTILFLLLLPIGLSAQNWEWFRDESAGFGVKTLQEFVEKEQKIATEIGEIKIHSFIYEPEEDQSLNFLFLINYCDYPKEDFSFESDNLISDFLNNSVQQSAEDLSGEVIYSSDITQNGLPGKLSRIEYSNHQAVVKSKMILANQRFYSIQVYSLIEQSLNDEIDTFLDSFQIIIRPN
jgi:hypothetical protein